MSLRDQLQAIYERRGMLTPALVVDEARNASHPLHDRFEWDNAVAGEAYRRSQAHELIRSVKVVYAQDPRGGERLVRAFHAVRTEKGNVYEPADKVASDPFLARMLLNDMEREWRTLRRRFEEFSEFWTMVTKDAPAQPPGEAA